MNNLKYTIELDAKGRLIPELKIVKQQMDAVAASVKKVKGQWLDFFFYIGLGMGFPRKF